VKVVTAGREPADPYANPPDVAHSRGQSPPLDKAVDSEPPPHVDRVAILEAQLELTRLKLEYEQEERKKLLKRIGKHASSNDGQRDDSSESSSSPRKHGRRRGSSDRSYSPTLRSRYDSDSASDNIDPYEDLNTKVFDFVPSRSSSNVGHSVSGESDIEIPVEVTKETIEEVGLGARKTPRKDAPKAVEDRTTCQIYHAQYTGEARPDGSHSATISVVHDPKKQYPPLFRWMHIYQKTMDFDKLVECVIRDAGLKDSDRSNLVKLLGEVRKSSKVKHTSNGNRVKYMPPRCIHSKLVSEEDNKSQTPRRRTLTWLCIPYFSLEQYTGLTSTKDDGAYPNQTLWQAQFSANPSERDLQQIVCQLGNSPPKSCFHISQLWCIVVDNGKCRATSREASAD